MVWRKFSQNHPRRNLASVPEMSLKAATSDSEKLGLHHQPFTSRPHQVMLPQDRVWEASPASVNRATKSEHMPSWPRQSSDLLSGSRNSRTVNPVMASKAGKTGWPGVELGSAAVSPFGFRWHRSCPLLSWLRKQELSIPGSSHGQPWEKGRQAPDRQSIGAK